MVEFCKPEDIMLLNSNMIFFMNKINLLPNNPGFTNLEKKPFENIVRKRKKLQVTTFYTPQNKCFWGVYWNKPVCPSVHVSICVQNTSFCQSAGGSIKSHLVTALVYPFKSNCNFIISFILLSANAFSFVIW